MRHEPDLGGQVGGRRDQPLVGLHQRAVEDLPEGRRQLSRARATCSPIAGRVGHHLVLVAGVELHVARLVHLLGGQERGLLLAAVGPHQP